MTNQHPIIPPLALIDQWWDEAKQNAKYDEPIGPLVATKAARWGADQELEACCKWLPKLPPWSGNDLRKHRRPKPLSLKEQALRDLDALAKDLERNGMGFGTAMIRRALEALDD